ncbi:hypothetical protein [Providencia sp. PROV223]|uniref:hypothetical protein n=1 Tax=Providencia sp. PROV223 TaxID=2949917 RepID=UPI00234AAAC2|nr:hypothetical protein [Providencia sp. PROV223]
MVHMIMIKWFNKKIIYLFFLFITFNSYSSSSWTVGNYTELKKYENNEKESLLISAYFDGLLDGILFTGGALKIANNEKEVTIQKIKNFYCPPPNFSFNRNILQEYVNEYLNINNVNDDEPIAVVALLALKEKFPCK